MSKDENKNPNRGPNPETLKVEGVDWEEAITHALKKHKPEGGWPEKQIKPTKKGGNDVRK